MVYQKRTTQTAFSWLNPIKSSFCCWTFHDFQIFSLLFGEHSMEIRSPGRLKPGAPLEWTWQQWAATSGAHTAWGRAGPIFSGLLGNNNGDMMGFYGKLVIFFMVFRYGKNDGHIERYSCNFFWHPASAQLPGSWESIWIDTRWSSMSGILPSCGWSYHRGCDSATWTVPNPHHSFSPMKDLKKNWGIHHSRTKLEISKAK